MWPEFSIWNFYMGILHYQMNFNYIQVWVTFSFSFKSSNKRYFLIIRYFLIVFERK